MKSCALSLTILGIATGVFFALGPWIFGTPTGTAGTYIAPSIVGAVLCVVHGLTLQRMRSGRGKWLGLLIWNAVVLALMTLGVVAAHSYGIGRRPAEHVPRAT